MKANIRTAGFWGSLFVLLSLVLAACGGGNGSASGSGQMRPLPRSRPTTAVVSALPVVILYMVFQRYLIGGLTVVGVKG